ncbi:MAG: hypothetical protein KIT80_18390 [Chitinophagaceae bacterium]|nr:hypothetical protein [Chitinophagaceae bacterium]MCW5928895.1 hypothetical protein [Chitinophagaceae bacterium]
MATIIMIPETFRQWKNCIENDCKTALTKDFAKRRLAVYTDQENPETKKFIRLYGKRHLENIQQWFQQIANSHE